MSLFSGMMHMGFFLAIRKITLMDAFQKQQYGFKTNQYYFPQKCMVTFLQKT